MDNISKAAADYILKELYELARNEFITSSELYQVMDKFIRSLVSEPGLPQTTADKIISFMDILIGAKGVTMAVELATHMTTNINSLVSEPDKGPRPMTPFEHQWMDFKKVLSELITFQKDYEERTKDYCPGNKYYADKLMGIVNEAKRVVDGEALVSEPGEDEFRPFIIHHLGKDKYEIFPLETNEEIAKRLFEEWKEWFFDSGTKQIDLVTFIPWLSWKK